MVINYNFSQNMFIKLQMMQYDDNKVSLLHSFN